MKLQINTDVKTITIDQSVNLGDLFELLNSMFPNFQWKDYLLVPEKEIHFWKDPITIPWNPQPWIVPATYPTYPVYTPNITPMPWTISCGTGTAPVTGSITTTYKEGYAAATSGTYNLIINKK